MVEASTFSVAVATIFSLLGLGHLTIIGSSSDAVKITLYYEAFCPGCQGVVKDLKKAVALEGVADILDVTLLPYGNAQTMGGKVTCQHGKDECTGNEWENCAIHYYPKFADHSKFIFCMEGYADAMLSHTNKCATKASMDFDKLSTCVSSGEGAKLHVAAGEKTGDHSYVPWVILNGKHSSAGEDNLLDAICKAYTGSNRPAACSSTELRSDKNTGEKCEKLTLVDENSVPVMSQQIVDAVNSAPGSTWTAGTNERFARMSVGQMRDMMNADTDGIKSLPVVFHADEIVESTPASFDPRVTKKACTGPVLDQAFCGSCWAFGATEAISDRLCLSKGEGAKFVQLAPLDLTACDSGFFAGENGCQGGQLMGAWNYAKKTGLVTESCFPYLKSEGGPVPTCSPSEQPCLPESKFIKTPACTKTCADGSSWGESKHQLKTVYSVSASQLKTELATNGPVESAFTVYADFVHYKSGVYQHTTGSMLGGHAIKVIGYGTEDGTDYWLVQNSWTTTWGDGGYFKIAHGQGIENSVVAGSF